MPAGHAALEAASQGDPMTDNPAVAVAVIVGGFVVAVVVIPLLLFGIELIILGFALAGAILVRGLLGRPWIVQASRGGTTPRVLTWKVAGWGHSARAVEEVAGQLEAGREPLPSEDAPQTGRS
jgi:hypothetical protein